MKNLIIIVCFFIAMCCKKTSQNVPVQMQVIISNPTLCYEPFAQLGYEAKVLGQDKVEIIPDLPNFDYKIGNYYELIISKTRLISKDQDAPSFTYKIVEILKSGPIVGASPVFGFSLDLSDKTLISYINKTKYSLLKKMTFECASNDILQKFENALNANRLINANFKIIGSNIILTDLN